MESAMEIAIGDAPLTAASSWLVREAALLDTHRYEEWFGLLSPRLRYRMPVRVTVADGDDDTPEGNGHFDETYASMDVRIRRLMSFTGWSEMPRSRARRFVTNILVESSTPQELVVRSYLLLLRSRLDSNRFEMLSAERRDVLVADEGPELRLVDRFITVDQASLGMINVAVLL